MDNYRIITTDNCGRVCSGFGQFGSFGNRIQLAGTHRVRQGEHIDEGLACCRIIAMVRCGGLNMAFLILHWFEPQRTLLVNNKYRKYGSKVCSSFGQFGNFANLIKLAGTHRIRGLPQDPSGGHQLTPRATKNRDDGEPLVT